MSHSVTSSWPAAVSSPKVTQPLRDQVALVTGASSGIGCAIAIALAAAGARLCVAGRNAERLARVMDEIRECGSQATAYEVDLCIEDEIERLGSAILCDHAGIDILTHSAGTISRNPFASAKIDDLDRQYQTNVRGPYLLTQRLLPSLIARRGQIVFINSSAGLRARAGVSQYAATKHALKAVADSLREELHEQGLRVLSVFPGNTATPMQSALCLKAGRPYNPEECLDPNDVATLIVATLGLRSAEVKEIDVRPRTR